MELAELFTICPPTRPLTISNQFTAEINKLRQNDNLSTFTDSVDLIRRLQKDLRTNSYQVYDPYDLLTLIHYRGISENKHFRYSRPIHFGSPVKDRYPSFTLTSPTTSNPDTLNQLYEHTIASGKRKFKQELRTQIPTTDDVYVLNRRILPFKFRVLSRPRDRKLVAFKFNWVEGQLL